MLGGGYVGWWACWVMDMLGGRHVGVGVLGGRHVGW